MNIIRAIYITPVTWRGWQFGVLKWSTISLGIVLGTVFADFWRPYLGLLGLIFVITSVWGGIMYFQGMHKSPGPVTTPETSARPL